MRDKAKVAANQRRYRAAHREEVAAYMGAYRAAHRKKRAISGAAWHAAHREERAISGAAWHAAHREERRAYMADRMKVLGETMRISKLPPELRELALSIRAVRQAIQRRNAA